MDDFGLDGSNLYFAPASQPDKAERAPTREPGGPHCSTRLENFRKTRDRYWRFSHPPLGLW